MSEDDEEAGGAGASEHFNPTPDPSRKREGRIGSNILPFATPPKPPRQRHDGFTPAKQKKFFKALKKSGCIADACRVAGISRNTVRRHRGKWPAFDDKVESALAIASVELDMIAWKRATEGAEERVWRDGKLVFTRLKPSDSMLRLLMQGADPKKYGRTGQMPRRAVMKKLRKEAEAEVRGKLRASEEDLTEEILTQLDVLDRRSRAQGRGPEGGGG